MFDIGEPSEDSSKRLEAEHSEQVHQPSLENNSKKSSHFVSNSIEDSQTENQVENVP